MTSYLPHVVKNAPPRRQSSTRTNFSATSQPSVPSRDPAPVNTGALKAIFSVPQPSYAVVPRIRTSPTPFNSTSVVNFDSAKISAAVDDLADAMASCAETIKRTANNARAFNEKNAKVSRAAQLAKMSVGDRFTKPSVVASRQQPRKECTEIACTKELLPKSVQDLNKIEGILKSLEPDGPPPGELLASVWGTRFVVGKHQSAACSMVRCFDDRLEYYIRDHPDEVGAKIKMMMYFKDLQNLSLNNRQYTLIFTVQKDLDYYPRHYKGGDKLVIAFKGDDFGTFESRIWPIMQRLKKC